MRHPGDPAAWFMALFIVAAVTGCDGGVDDDSATGDDDDTAPWPESFVGSVTITSSFGGLTECDATVELLGTQYTGECDGCSFAFAIDAELVRDDGTEACSLIEQHSFIPSADVFDLLLAHHPEFSDQGWYGPYTFYDALLGGYSFVEDGVTYPGPYWALLAHDDDPGSTLSWDGGADIAWTIDDAAELTRTMYRDDCGAEVPESALETGSAGAYVGSSAVDCAGAVGDVWTVTGVAGATFTIAVDTVATDTAFDPRMWINGPDGCTAKLADDNLDCSYPPPTGYQCPSAELEMLDGAYQIVVLAYGSCAGDTAAYQLIVDAPAEPQLTLTYDDVDVLVTETYVYAVEGHGTLTY